MSLSKPYRPCSIVRVAVIERLSFRSAGSRPTTFASSATTTSDAARAGGASPAASGKAKLRSRADRRSMAGLSSSILAADRVAGDEMVGSDRDQGGDFRRIRERAERAGHLALVQLDRVVAP